MKHILGHFKCGTIAILAVISLTLLIVGFATEIQRTQITAKENNIPEHKCCHNGQCCGTENCCDDKGCKSAKCPAIKGNDKDKKKKKSS